MRNFILLGCLVPSVIATSFGSNSAIITGQDVRNGIDWNNFPLTPGGKYRVYAVYASSASSSIYARNVVISGTDNNQFTVASLAVPKSGTTYVLDNANEITAPVTVIDSNNASDTGFAARVPYTIYFASTTIPVAPVIGAHLPGIQVDSSTAQLSSPSCTILSAEMAVWISDIVVDTSSMDKIDVKSAGYDVISDGNTFMTVMKESLGSSVAISSPIFTLYNTNALPANFSFTLKTEGAWSGTLTPGASTAFLSNGWLSVLESYRTEYSNELVLARSYDFGRETEVSFAPIIGNYYPDNGDSVKFTCGKDNGKSAVYDCGALADSQQKDRCRTIVLSVTKGGTVDGPRFRVQIDSGAFSIPTFVLVIASFIRFNYD